MRASRPLGGTFATKPIGVGMSVAVLVGIYDPRPIHLDARLSNLPTFSRAGLSAKNDGPRAFL